MNGNEFRTLRKDLDLSQPRLAELLNISTNTVVNIEKSLMVKRVYEYAIKFIQIREKKSDIRKIAQQINYMM